MSNTIDSAARSTVPAGGVLDQTTVLAPALPTSGLSSPTAAVAPPAYRDHAGRYDHRTRMFQHWRELLVTQLDTQPGDTVLDVGCGTGLCLPHLQRKIGPTGTIVGIDESQDMLNIAADRVTHHGWSNVQFINGPVDQARIDITADAALFCAVHDVLQSPTGLANIFSRLRPGSAIAAIGGKWPTPLLWPLRPWVADLHDPFITDFTGFDQPWKLLAEYVPDLKVRQLAFSTGYLAHGHTPST